MSLHALLLLTIYSPITTTTTSRNNNASNAVVAAWSPPNRMPLQLPSISNDNNKNRIIGGHHVTPSFQCNSKLRMTMSNNSNNNEERRPIAREGEWSAYMDENYDRVYYFNHESVSASVYCRECYIVCFDIVGWCHCCMYR